MSRGKNNGKNSENDNKKNKGNREERIVFDKKGRLTDESRRIIGRELETAQSVYLVFDPQPFQEPWPVGEAAICGSPGVPPPPLILCRFRRVGVDELR